MNRNPFRAAGTFLGESYVERAADRELWQELQSNRRYPYVLAPRQSGKSSLLQRCRMRLRSASIESLYVDLSTFDMNHRQTMAEFIEDLDDHSDTAGSTAKPPKTILSWAYARARSRPLVIFIDEVDRLEGSAIKDVVLGQIRACFNARAWEEESNLITFVLAGAGSVERLITNPDQSPFNIGVEIVLEDLRLDELAQMLRHFTSVDGASAANEAAVVLNSWTGGSVYLSQLVLENVWDELSEDASLDDLLFAIERISLEIVHDPRRNVHFVNIAGQLEANPDALHALEVIDSQGSSSNSSGILFLQEIGLVRADGTPRNGIYREKFFPKLSSRAHQRGSFSRRTRLQSILTSSSPLGPLAADLPQYDQAIPELFVSPRDGTSSHRVNAPLIVGRRGSGKSTFLRQLAVGSGGRSTWVDLDLALHVLEGALDSRIFVETAALAWDLLIEHYLMADMSRVPATSAGREDVATLRRYLGMGDLDELPSAERAAADFFHRATSEGRSLSRRGLGEVRVNGVSYERASRALARLIGLVGGAIVLIDSIEQFDDLLWNPVRSQLFAGLLRAASTAQRQLGGVSIHVAIPSENLRELSSVSSNPLKDFANTYTISWSNRELIAMVERRLELYLSLHASAEDRSLRGGESLLRELLPTEIRRSIHSVPEDPVAYVLRHTQSLPRQVLAIFNEVFAARGSGAAVGRRVSSDDVVHAVRRTAPALLEDVARSFSLPRGVVTLAEFAATELPGRFRIGDLHRLFNTSQIRRSQGISFDEALERLVASGLLGQVTVTSDRYVEALFQYLVSARLEVHRTSSDAMCVHPLVVAATRRDGAPGSPDDKPVYPTDGDT